MRPNPPRRAAPHRIHPALSSFADDCSRTLTGLLLYVGALALIGILVATTAGPLTEAAITAATELAAGRIDLAATTDNPEILQPADDGRKTPAQRAAWGRDSAASPGPQKLGLRGAI
ncbi:hypothetical protein [Rhodopseudomonas telluris]|uniref:Uncharacterized protein n=1 Tax=Rhodopseudomonas telluris TaxID=644215 RepID=A0ABV6EQT6_9BRAD